MGNNSDSYIEKYKELETVVRDVYGLKDDDSISYYLTNKEKYKKFNDEIRYCQKIRNFIQHEKKLGNKIAIEPTNETIEFIQMLIEKVQNRKKCKDICVRYKDIFSQSLEGNVKETMRVMKENNYTCVPILNGKKVIGVFDENSLFEYINSEEIVAVDESLTFSDIKGYLSLEDREMEEFLFFKENEYAENLEKEFEKSFRKCKRIAVVFLTADGKKESELYGIITAWDILGNEY